MKNNVGASGETTAKIVWPTIGATSAGRWVGQAASVRVGVGKFFTLGKLFALAAVPVAVPVFFWQLLPPFARRYRLTNRRIVIERAFGRAELASLGLEDFDSVEVEILAGQSALRAGELVFRRQGEEVLRLGGVPRPDVFREICLKARRAVVAVGDTVRQQSQPK